MTVVQESAPYPVPTPLPAVHVAATGAPPEHPVRVDVADVLLRAYRSAAAGAPGSCHLPVSLLAAIGEVESGSLVGRLIDAEHRTAVLGPVLDGRGFAAIPDTDGGRWDGNVTWDRAVGPMQFIPGTWKAFGADGGRRRRGRPSRRRGRCRRCRRLPLLRRTRSRGPGGAASSDPVLQPLRRLPATSAHLRPTVLLPRAGRPGRDRIPHVARAGGRASSDPCRCRCPGAGHLDEHHGRGSGRRAPRAPCRPRRLRASTLISRPAPACPLHPSSRRPPPRLPRPVDSQAPAPEPTTAPSAPVAESAADPTTGTVPAAGLGPVACPTPAAATPDVAIDPSAVTPAPPTSAAAPTTDPCAPCPDGIVPTPEQPCLPAIPAATDNATSPS